MISAARQNIPKINGNYLDIAMIKVSNCSPMFIVNNLYVKEIQNPIRIYAVN